MHHRATVFKQCGDGRDRGGIFIAVRLILYGLSHSPAVMADKGLSEKPPSNKDGQLSRGRAAAYVLISA